MSAKCRNCQHFYITYDPKTPNGCKAYQIQSQAIPSQVVKRANNGQECLGFKAKASQAAQKKLDLNDDRYW